MIELQRSEKDIGRIVEAVIQLTQGRSNAVGTVTLRAGQTTTTVSRSVHPAAVNVGMGSQVFLSPRSASAAAALATTYISDVQQEQFTITHANDPSTTREFGWVSLG